MNRDVLEFFNQHYAPGRVGLVGSSELIYKLIREGQCGLTLDGKPSKWNHCFLMGMKREDGRDDGSIYIYESDLHVSVPDWEVKNGAMESRIGKWCRDDLEHAAVLGMALSPGETESLLRKALKLAYDENHLRYPVGELFGTLWAIITRKLAKKNIFDIKYAVHCTTFVRMCYQSISRDFITVDIDPSNAAPEHAYQSPLFSFRKEW